MKHQLTCYLASAMEAAKDLGSGWRSDITPFLKELDFEVLNPVLFEPKQLEGLHPSKLPSEITNKYTGEIFTPTHWHQLKLAKEKPLFKRFLRYMRRIISYDIKVVTQKADIIICYWNRETQFGAGTHSELTYGFLTGKEIYCVEEAPMPGWAMACCTRIFPTFEELKVFLKEEFGG